MQVMELKRQLEAHPAAEIRFLLPDGTLIPAHAHVTEIARIDKHFIDCGGTVRAESCCRLQTWVADDREHRLNAKKLLGILEKAAPVLRSEELEVDVEYEALYISQFSLLAVDVSSEQIAFRLGSKHTACLAPEKCCPPGTPLVALGASRKM